MRKQTAKGDQPLAQTSDLRLRECLNHPHIAPSVRNGVRSLLAGAANGIGRKLAPVVETESFELIRHYVQTERTIGFQIPIGPTPLGEENACRAGRFRRSWPQVARHLGNVGYDCI